MPILEIVALKSIYSQNGALKSGGVLIIYKYLITIADSGSKILIYGAWIFLTGQIIVFRLQTVSTRFIMLYSIKNACPTFL